MLPAGGNNWWPIYYKHSSFCFEEIAWNENNWVTAMTIIRIFNWSIYYLWTTSVSCPSTGACYLFYMRLLLLRLQRCTHRTTPSARPPKLSPEETMNNAKPLASPPQFSTATPRMRRPILYLFAFRRFVRWPSSLVCRSAGLSASDRTCL